MGLGGAPLAAGPDRRPAPTVPHTLYEREGRLPTPNGFSKLRVLTPHACQLVCRVCEFNLISGPPGRRSARGPSSLALVAHELVAREAGEALRAAVEPHDGLLQMDE